MMSNENTPLWVPTSATPQSVTDNYGRLVSGHRVHYRISDGATGYVDIPDSVYNAQMVQDTIHKAVQKHFQVMQLQGPPVGMGHEVEPPQLDNVIH